MSQFTEGDRSFQLQALTPLDGRYRGEVADLATYLAEEPLIRTRLEVEAKYLVAMSDAGLVRVLTEQEREALFAMGPGLTLENALRVKEIEDTTRHDVKAMERVFREQVAGTSLADITEWIHFGLTSEDINNLAYRLMSGRARDGVSIPAFDQVVNRLALYAETYKGLPMLARTHGQAAVPTTLGKEFAVFAWRLHNQVRQLESVPLTGKLNGAVGNYNAHMLAAPEINWIQFSRDFVTSLGLKPNLYTTQINQYDDMVELFQAYMRTHGVLMDLNQDMWRYISDGWLKQMPKAGEVGSSTMPQKVNPIDFENSEGNLGAANSLLEFLSRKLPVSRLQRDLSDSTTMRQMGPALGHSLLATRRTYAGLGKVSANEQAIEEALGENLAILTEGVQTVLRRAGVTDPYSMIASLVRGRQIGPEEWQQWVAALPIEEHEREQLQALTPQNYVGHAQQLTEMALAEIRASRGVHQ